MSNNLLSTIEKHKNTLKKIVPVNLLRSGKQFYVDRLLNRFISQQESAEERKRQCPFGVNLIGDIKVEIGLGQSMRLLANALKQAGIPMTIYEYSMGGNVRHGDTTWNEYIGDELKYSINIFHINQQEVQQAFLALGNEVWKNHYNIAFWLWELEEFPDENINIISLFDEIWTPSEFASNSVRKVTSIPVRTVPYCVTAEADVQCYEREYFGLPKDKFLFMIMYDTNSTMSRKNPAGAIEAYKKAFPDERRDVGLVIKMNNPKIEEIVQLQEQLKSYQNVYFVDKILSKVEVNSLIANVDVFVSLHRAEGFGLVMAEAMLLGTICVATNWSSNTEFMNSDVACMVDFKMAELQEDDGPYKKESRWADADTGEAALYMKRLVDDAEYRKMLIDKAKKHVKEQLGETNITTLLKEYLKKM